MREKPVWSDVIGLIDIGSSKIACAVAGLVRTPQGRLEVGQILGFAHRRSRGVKSGVIIDLDEAERAVRAVVHEAETVARARVSRVVATINCGRLKSHRFKAHVTPAGMTISQADLERLQDGARSYAERGDRVLIHWNHLGFELDGEGGIAHPLGLAAETLTGCYHMVSADQGPVSNLLAVLERSYLTVEGLVPAAIASAYSVTTSDERALGVTVVDHGGGTTSYTTFANQTLSGCGVLAFGGEALTLDIARRLLTTFDEAERLKTLYGSTVIAPSDQASMVSYRPADPDRDDLELDADGLCVTSRAELNTIIQRRSQLQVERLAEALDAAATPAHGERADRIVVTGGASLLRALPMTAARMLGKPTRAGRPADLPGLPLGPSAAAFAALAGLAIAVPQVLADADRRLRSRRPSSYVAVLQKWVLDTF
ncbi:MAG: cell division protein FtsA [Hyphomicrobiaceae bacterium]